MALRCNKILITGGSRGIGFAMAKRLCAEGASVVITGKDPDHLQKALKELPKGRAFALEQDVTECDIMPGLVEEAAILLGGLNCLINNAGIDPGNELEYGMGLFDVTPELWDNVMNTNLRSVFFMTKAVAWYMLNHNPLSDSRSTFRYIGDVLNVSSEAAFVPATGAYGVSKYGVKGLTAGWASFLGDFGIIVNGIAPGTTMTDMINLPMGMEQRRQKNGRLATPEEMASLAAWMLSNESVNIMGQTILSCGGSTIL